MKSEGIGAGCGRACDALDKEGGRVASLFFLSLEHFRTVADRIGVALCWTSQLRCIDYD